mmetsp:Transcript_42512/g.105826  ORF Transcript_42512/g.105826 Transcript_42512/m.105826 type:complete len:224 (+) Transcript_42512:106-777(+)
MARTSCPQKINSLRMRNACHGPHPSPHSGSSSTWSTTRPSLPLPSRSRSPRPAAPPPPRPAARAQARRLVASSQTGRFSMGSCPFPSGPRGFGGPSSQFRRASPPSCGQTSPTSLPGRRARRRPAGWSRTAAVRTGRRAAATPPRRSPRRGASPSASAPSRSSEACSLEGATRPRTVRSTPIASLGSLHPTSLCTGGRRCLARTRPDEGRRRGCAPASPQAAP